ncbi:uncharacterized protein LOC134787642 [Penaeus indicus]|uniref:uncharacterized protein LOC134787642 n=1 Tax=Penaeus indicus TaxID=29960 RepID=UPI00300C7DA3
MENYRKPTVNRYWKRPKPKVYECNVRDAERLYQQSYQDYLKEKEFRAGRATSLGLEPTFYSHLVAGPIRRETSKPPPAPPSYKAQEARESSAEAVTKLSSHEVVSSYDPAKEAASLEERLARIKRLREELGLPGETQTGSSRVTTSLSRETRGGASEYESSYKADKSSRANGDDSYSFKSERTSNYSRPGADDSYSFKSERSSNYSRPGIGEESSYSLKSERSSRAGAANGLSSDDYSFKSERKATEYKSSPKVERKQLDFDLGSKFDRKGLDMSPKLDRKSDDYSFKSSAASSSSSRARKNVVEKLDFDDDDVDVMSMMKKMPSSQEILDRISKMDLDD